MAYLNGKQHKRAHDIPKEEHYAIILQGSYAEHDYYNESSPSTKYCVEYYSYVDKANWESDVTALTTTTASYSKQEFVAMKVTPAKVTTKISVDIE